MADPIRPMLDYYPEGTTEEFDDMMDVKGAERWIAETDEGRTYHEYYANAKNFQYLQGWLTNNGPLPCTKTNLSCAFRELVKAGTLKPNPPAEPELDLEDPGPFQQPGRDLSSLMTVKLNHPKLHDHEARLRAESPIGKPPSEELKTAHRQSLEESRTKQGLPARWAECRAVTYLNHPELKLDSPRFNELVAQLLAEQS